MITVPISKSPNQAVLPILLRFSFILSLGTFPLHATPDHSVAVSERLLGSNKDGYAIIRTETDNMGSYYQEKRVVWLDEYSKADGPSAKPTKSTQFLELNISIDIDDQNKVTTKAGDRSQRPSLADVVERYTTMIFNPWDADQFAELKFNPNTGHTTYKSQTLIGDGALLGTRFRASGSENHLSLRSVEEDSNSTFLNISTPRDEGSELRVICISPKATSNLRALKDLKPIYLSAGTFGSAKEALAHLNKLAENKTLPRHNMEVWSVFHADTEKTDYSVVLENSEDIIRRNELSASQEPLGLNLIPISSEGFREMQVEESP